MESNGPRFKTLHGLALLIYSRIPPRILRGFNEFTLWIPVALRNDFRERDLFMDFLFIPKILLLIYMVLHPELFDFMDPQTTAFLDVNCQWA